MPRNQYFIGIDLHKSVIQISVVDGQGEVVHRERCRIESLQDGLDVVRRLGRWARGGRCAVEAVGVNRWFVNACREAGYDIVVVDAVKLGLRRLGKKTDRRDALELARRLRLGDLDRHAATYYPSEEEYGARKIERVRHHLVKQRQQVINQLRGLLNAYKQPSPGLALYTKPCRRKLRELGWSNEALARCRDALVDVLEAIQSSIEALDQEIAHRAREERSRELQRSAPCLGPQSAVTILAELGDVTRFRNARAAASYAGLVPRVANSADTAHHGRLTKRGSRELRWILSQWAVRLLARDPLVQRWAAPRLRRSHKNKVRMALARRLLVGLYVMLARGEVFSLRRCLGLVVES